MVYSKSNPLPFDQAIELAKKYKQDGATKIALMKVSTGNEGWVVEASSNYERPISSL